MPDIIFADPFGSYVDGFQEGSRERREQEELVFNTIVAPALNARERQIDRDIAAAAQRRRASAATARAGRTVSATAGRPQNTPSGAQGVQAAVEQAASVGTGPTVGAAPELSFGLPAAETGIFAIDAAPAAAPAADPSSLIPPAVAAAASPTALSPTDFQFAPQASPAVQAAAPAAPVAPTTVDPDFVFPTAGVSPLIDTSPANGFGPAPDVAQPFTPFDNLRDDAAVAVAGTVNATNRATTGAVNYVLGLNDTLADNVTSPIINYIAGSEIIPPTQRQPLQPALLDFDTALSAARNVGLPEAPRLAAAIDRANPQGRYAQLRQTASAGGLDAATIRALQARGSITRPQAQELMTLSGF